MYGSDANLHHPYIQRGYRQVAKQSKLTEEAKMSWKITEQRPYLPHVLTLSVQINHQVLKDVHMCRVSDGTSGGRGALAVDVCDGLSAHVEHK